MEVADQNPVYANVLSMGTEVLDQDVGKLQDEESKLSPPSFNWPLPLDKLYYWEQYAPARTCFFQPISKRRTRTFSWSEVADQTRRVAQYLISLDLPAGSHIGIMSPNSAHWIIADLAIWMAGHVSVPIFPNMNETYRNCFRLGLPSFVNFTR